MLGDGDVCVCGGWGCVCGCTGMEMYVFGVEMCVCVCVCACACVGGRDVCVCVCFGGGDVCVCVRERGRERESKEAEGCCLQPPRPLQVSRPAIPVLRLVSAWCTPSAPPLAAGCVSATRTTSRGLASAKSDDRPAKAAKPTTSAWRRPSARPSLVSVPVGGACLLREASAGR